jgi:hypothetical protein
MMREPNVLPRSLDELREQRRMTWTDHGSGWSGQPDDVFSALAEDGFEECKVATTASRSDCRPAGGLWQGVNPRTGSVASAIWVAGAVGQPAILFIQIDGAPITAPDRDAASPG